MSELSLVEMLTYMDYFCVPVPSAHPPYLQ